MAVNPVGKKLNRELVIKGYEFFDTLADGVFIHDYEGNIMYVNGSGAKLYGVSRNELIGNKIAFIKSMGIKFLFGLRRDILQKNGHYSMERCEYRKDGTPVYVRVHSYAARINSNNMIISAVHELVDKKCTEVYEDPVAAYTIEPQHLQIIHALTTITEIRDPYTSSHQKRVARLAHEIGRELRFTGHQITGLYVAGLLHDIGKIYVPNEILTRPGSINEYEFNLIKKHCEVGYEILYKIEFPWPVAEYVVQHHERIDGSGYPYNLKREEIHIESMVLAVADVVESISSHRPYRPALGIGYAIEEIKKGKNTLYEARVVDACLRVLTRKNFNFDEVFDPIVLHTMANV